MGHRQGSAKFSESCEQQLILRDTYALVVDDLADCGQPASIWTAAEYHNATQLDHLPLRGADFDV